MHTRTEILDEPPELRPHASARRFRWRDLRDFGLSVEFWPFHWWPLFWTERDDDGFGGRVTLLIGPLLFRVDYNAVDGPFRKSVNDL